MLAIGQDLYRLTSKDEETLLIEPYFRGLTIPVPAAVLSGNAQFQLPFDRCLFFKHGMVRVTPGAAQTAAIVQWQILSPVSQLVANTLFDVRGVLVGDNQAAAVAGGVVCFNFDAGIVLPPGCILQAYMEKSAAANAGFFSAEISGYLIPPGRIGRVF